MVFQWFFQNWGPMVHDGQILGTNGSLWLQTVCDKLHVENRNASYRLFSQKILHFTSYIVNHLQSLRIVLSTVYFVLWLTFGRPGKG